MPILSDPKPAGLDLRYAERFCDARVADAYQHLPPYPRELFDILVRLMPSGEPPGNVLDVGCGRGEVARPLVARPEVQRVDAIDLSAAMIARGEALPNGDHPRLRWICSELESAALAPPYALIAAGSSLHWLLIRPMTTVVRGRPPRGD